MKILGLLLAVIGVFAFAGAAFGLGVYFSEIFGLSKDLGFRLFQVSGVIAIVDKIFVVATLLIKKYI